MWPCSNLPFFPIFDIVEIDGEIHFLTTHVTLIMVQVLIPWCSRLTGRGKKWRLVYNSFFFNLQVQIIFLPVLLTDFTTIGYSLFYCFCHNWGIKNHIDSMMQPGKKHKPVIDEGNQSASSDKCWKALMNRVTW